MIILGEPYVSTYLEETIIKHQIPVYREPGIHLQSEDQMLILDEKSFFDHYRANKETMLYTNSENTLSVINKNLEDTYLNQTTKILKDKVAFREAIQSLYPDFYFSRHRLDQLLKLDENMLPFPLILKPSVGFFSMGVYQINQASEWKQTVTQIKKEEKQNQGLFPDCVIDYDEFIIEKYIEGTEYAVDAYYKQDGKAVIINIFEHLFSDEKDTSDRIYFTGFETIQRWHDIFQEKLTQIGRLLGIQNYPVHIELRVTPDHQIIPIEVNPMRFAGWCTTDIAHYAWGINPYETFFFQQEPNWDEILNRKQSKYFCMNIADIPAHIDRSRITNVHYKEFLGLFSKIDEWRKIDYHQHQVFAFVFSQTNDYEEMQRFSKKDLSQYLEISKL